jgi:glycosyltransferase involved in cell wall biosynthesis
MKIVIIMPLAVQLGGGEKMFLDLLQHGRNSSIEWTAIFLKDGPMLEQVRALGVNVYLVESGRMRELHRMIAAVWSIAKIVRENQIHLIVSWMSTTHLYGGLAAAFCGIPAYRYELDHPSNQGLLKRVITSIPAAGVITLSKADYIQQQQISSGSKVSLVYPGVDLSRFESSVLPTPDEARKNLGLPCDVPIIGIVGRMQRWKGIHTVIEAMPSLLKKNPDIHCLIVGGRHPFETAYFDEMEALIEKLNLQGSITLAGQQQNIPEWMQAMDICIHASSDEPFGIVVIEAMALGKPTVAGADGGPTEIITPNIDGLLAPYNDHKALSDAILYYLDNPEFATQFGERAKRRAQDFSVQQYAKKFIFSLQQMQGISVQSPYLN